MYATKLLIIIDYISVHKPTSFYWPHCLQGVYPSDMCICEIEDSSNIVRLECPLNCNVALENAILDDVSSNDCGGFGSGLCSYSSGWVGVWGRECWAMMILVALPISYFRTVITLHPRMPAVTAAVANARIPASTLSIKVVRMMKNGRRLLTTKSFHVIGSKRMTNRDV